jgi:hypothetical protein
MRASACVLWRLTTITTTFTHFCFVLLFHSCCLIPLSFESSRNGNANANVDEMYDAIALDYLELVRIEPDCTALHTKSLLEGIAMSDHHL